MRPRSLSTWIAIRQWVILLSVTVLVGLQLASEVMNIPPIGTDRISVLLLTFILLEIMFPDRHTGG